MCGTKMGIVLATFYRLSLSLDILRTRVPWPQSLGETMVPSEPEAHPVGICSRTHVLHDQWAQRNLAEEIWRGAVFLSQRPGKASGFRLPIDSIQAEEVKIIGSGVRWAPQLISSVNLIKLFNSLSLFPEVPFNNSG